MNTSLFRTEWLIGNWILLRGNKMWMIASKLFNMA
jgi:hypothetical protein